MGLVISQGFIEAIPRLRDALSRLRDARSDSTLGPRLVEYIPDPAEFYHDTFLQGIAEGIVEAVKSEKILKSWDDIWIIPTETMIIPPAFFIDGVPLLDEDKFNEFSERPLKYLKGGAAYSSTRCQKILTVLNCQTLTFDTVCTIFEHPRFAFSQMPESWFPKFFRFIRPGLSSQDRFRLLSLPFLKLENGTWVSCSEGQPVYLPTSSLRAFPDQIRLGTLDRDFYAAMQDDEDQFGVWFLEHELRLERLTSQQVAKAVITHHDQINNKEIDPSRSDTLFEHAKYLYEHRQSVLTELSQTWLRKLKTSFQLFDREQLHCLSNQLVLDRDIQWNSESYRLSTIESRSLRILHQNYSEHDGIMAFIHEYLDLAKFPPLMDQSGNLSEFYLIDIAPRKQFDNRLLSLLAERGISDAIDIVPIRPRFNPFSVNAASSTRFRRQLRDVEVLCENRSFNFKRLETCYLPTKEMKPLLQNSAMDILRLPDPDNVKWQFLGVLGVKVRPDMELCIKKLNDLKAASVQSESLKIEVGKIYTLLERVTTRNEYDRLRYLSVPHILGQCN
jgi:hypothetical protein